MKSKPIVSMKQLECLVQTTNEYRAKELSKKELEAVFDKAYAIHEAVVDRDWDKIMLLMGYKKVKK